ncbi:hypothetical protein RI578_07385 [Streptomyces sp. BB1-1-1]|uniref:hypothetical protein n=1 Tax=Streptomyces sp. BB1-1-1 TaxID=3074430 RepID=UPI0028775311|nr:hypothetical protein [Streptomyces sp. BB1-1-1]WND34119.1 hypothetical protein RI578_07385 [Streptomyces sp. BB1-1-1]
MPTTDAYGRVGSVNEVWDELLERIPLPPGTTTDQNESMLKQLACHLLYAIPDHECNWGFEGDRLPSPGANWDIDRAEPKRVTVGAMIIDSGWIPGLPQPRGTGGLLDDLLPGIGLDLGR